MPVQELLYALLAPYGHYWCAMNTGVNFGNYEELGIAAHKQGDDVLALYFLHRHLKANERISPTQDEQVERLKETYHDAGCVSDEELEVAPLSHKLKLLRDGYLRYIGARAELGFQSWDVMLSTCLPKDALRAWEKVSKDYIMSQTAEEEYLILRKFFLENTNLICAHC